MIKSYAYWNTNYKLYRTNTAILFKKKCRLNHLSPKYINKQFCFCHLHRCTVYFVESFNQRTNFVFVILYLRLVLSLQQLCRLSIFMFCFASLKWQPERLKYAESYNKEFSVLYLQSETPIFHPGVQQEYNYMFRPYMWAIFRLCFDLQSSCAQPEDGPHIGPKHVVVFLLYYQVKYSCVLLYV